MMRSWSVRMYWQDARGSFEAGADAAFPSTMGPMPIIEEVARWRGVNLATCKSVEAKHVGDDWDVPDDPKETTPP